MPTVERAVRYEDADVLDQYGPSALARVWKVQHFSYWMTSMPHTLPGSTDFDLYEQLGELESAAAPVVSTFSLTPTPAGLLAKAVNHAAPDGTQAASPLQVVQLRADECRCAPSDSRLLVSRYVRITAF